MRRGRTTHAAGLASTGTAPIPALKTSSHFGTLHPKTAACSLKKLNFAELARFTLRNARGMMKSLSSGPSIAAPISNRHLLRLEIAATPAKSATSLFLIDTNRPHFPRTHFRSPETLVAQARPACVRFPSRSHRTYSISTVYSVQLKIAATPTPSTKLFTLLGTHSRVRLVAIRLRRPPVAFLAPLGNTFPESSGGLL
jgi:hypothetical protein